MTFDDLNGDDLEFRRARRTPDTRQQTPRASRTTKYKRKRLGGANATGGVHQRRNKHWGW